MRGVTLRSRGVLRSCVEFAAALLLAGCAVAPQPASEGPWSPDDRWWAEARLFGGWIARDDGTRIRVSAAHARNLFEVAAKIQQQSGVAAQIALADDKEMVAYAIEANGRRQIVFSLPLLEAIGNDRDALATTIGHEAAHLLYAHNLARKSRNDLAIGNSAALAGILAVNTSFTRYEEREADLKGIEWATAAGFSACGTARVMRMLRSNDSGAGANSFLAMHPGYGERIARATDLASRLDGRGC